jgi:hypothetical protein
LIGYHNNPQPLTDSVTGLIYLGEEGAKGDASERQCARQRLFRDAKDVTHNMRFERQLL